MVDDAEEMFSDDPNLTNTLVDEEFFGDTRESMDTDETLVEIPEGLSLDEDVEDESPSIGDDDDYNDDESIGESAPKAGWSEDTVQTEAMARLGICVNTVARVIICMACASAIKPLELPEHLAKTHPPISTSTAYSQELVNTYDLRSDLDSRPGTIITAIYGLELVNGYLTCNNCGYACKSEKAMGRHMKNSKGCNTVQERPVQTFRPSSKRSYFGVNLEPEPAEEAVGASLDPLTFLKKKFAPIPFSSIPIKSPKTSQDANHFLNLERWDLYVEGKTGAEIRDAVREREPELRNEVRICVERYAIDIVEKLIGVDHELRAAMADYTG